MANDLESRIDAASDWARDEAALEALEKKRNKAADMMATNPPPSPKEKLCEICGDPLQPNEVFVNAANETVCIGCFQAFIPTDGANLPRVLEDKPYA